MTGSTNSTGSPMEAIVMETDSQPSPLDVILILEHLRKQGFRRVEVWELSPLSIIVYP